MDMPVAELVADTVFDYICGFILLGPKEDDLCIDDQSVKGTAVGIPGGLIMANEFICAKVNSAH